MSNLLLSKDELKVLITTCQVDLKHFEMYRRQIEAQFLRLSTALLRYTSQAFAMGRMSQAALNQETNFIQFKKGETDEDINNILNIERQIRKIQQKLKYTLVSKESEVRYGSI